MNTYIQAYRFGVWRSTVDGYKSPATPSMDRDGKKLEENDSMDRNTIDKGLNLSLHTNIMHCESTNEMWDKMKTIYEGDEKFKEGKLQIFRAKFEQLKMNEDENIET
jgi:hypothetical protein